MPRNQRPTLEDRKWRLWGVLFVLAPFGMVGKGGGPSVWVCACTQRNSIQGSQGRPRQREDMRRHPPPNHPLSSLLLCCCSVLGRHSAPSTSHCCAAQRVRLRGLSPRPMPAGVVAPSETHLRIRAARLGGRSLGTRQPKTRCCSCRLFTKHTGRQRTCF
jgi:hypothetical protein